MGDETPLGKPERPSFPGKLCSKARTQLQPAPRKQLMFVWLI